MSADLSSGAVRRKDRHRGEGSRIFFGESQSGVKYEYKGDLPTEEEFRDVFVSDDGDDAFEDVGNVRVHYNRADEKTKPKVIQHYVLGPKIGEGAYAKVVEGMDNRSLRMVAVKIINKRHVSKMQHGMEDVKHEISIMKSMKKHQNVIELIDIIDTEDSSKIYLMLELANGCSLQELIDQAPDNRIPVNQTKFFVRQLMLGLQYLHSKNIVHRDIKPANLMLTTEFELKISDFGAAEFLDKYNGHDRVTRTKGSPAFYAPEITKGDYTFSGMAVDVWAAGVVLYYALVGKLPFDAENIRTCSSRTETASNTIEAMELVLFSKISSGTFEMPDFLDSDGRDLIQQMLTIEASERISVSDVLRHPWLQEHSVKGPRNFIPVTMREVALINMLSTIYDADDADGDSGEGTGAVVQASTFRNDQRTNRWIEFLASLTDIRCTIM